MCVCVCVTRDCVFMSVCESVCTVCQSVKLAVSLRLPACERQSAGREGGGGADSCLILSFALASLLVSLKI